MDVVRDIIQIFGNYEFPTKVLVASVRHPLHVTEAARLGADVVTMPPEVLGKLISHPLTDIGLTRFLEDWKRAKQQAPNPKISISR